jgi:hypothetical protein
MLRRVAWWKLTDVSEVRTADLFRVARVHFGNNVTLCTMKNSCLVSGNTIVNVASI